MRRNEEIDRVLERVLDVLRERLEPDGWRRRPVGRPSTGTYTRPVHGDVIATLDISRRGFPIPDDWPVMLGVVPGAGSEAALGLWPLLGRTTHAAVTWDPAIGGPNGAETELDGGAGTRAFVEEVVALAAAARAFTEQFPDLDALVAHERDRPATPPPAPGRHLADARPAAAAGPDEETGDEAADEAHVPSMADLVHVLATGRLDETRALLTEFEVASAADGGSGSERRFARQVRRRLDAGTRDVPPLEETLALLPPRRGPDAFSWSSIQADTSARRAARDAVGARAAGKSAEEVVEDLAAEYGSRGLPIQRSALAVAADQILLARQPLGRLKVAARSAVVLAGAGRQLVHRFRNLGEQEAPSVRPPDRAAYPMGDHPTSGYAAVVLDPGADELLDRARRASLLHVAGSAALDVWFTAGPADADGPVDVVAHLGPDRVGVVPADQTAGFPAVFRAAALFDEDPVVAATLARAGSRWYLDFPAPAIPD